MKKHIVFTIALCIGLTLPAINFGAQSSWSSWASDRLRSAANYFSSSMPQWPNLSQWATNLVNRLNYNQKIALLGALTVTLGLGAAYYSGGAKRQEDADRKKNLRQMGENLDTISKNLTGVDTALSQQEEKEKDLQKYINAEARKLKKEAAEAPILDQQQLTAPTTEAPILDQQQLTAPTTEAPILDQQQLTAPTTEAPILDQQQLTAPTTEAPILDQQQLTAPTTEAPIRDFPQIKIFLYEAIRQNTDDLKEDLVGNTYKNGQTILKILFELTTKYPQLPILKAQDMILKRVPEALDIEKNSKIAQEISIFLKLLWDQLSNTQNSINLNKHEFNQQLVIDNPKKETAIRRYLNSLPYPLSDLPTSITQDLLFRAISKTLNLEAGSDLAKEIKEYSDRIISETIEKKMARQHS